MRRSESGVRTAPAHTETGGGVEEFPHSSPAVSAREEALLRTLSRFNEFASKHPDEFAHLQKWAATGHRFSESLLWAIAKGEALSERQLAAVRRAIDINKQYLEHQNGTTGPHGGA